jgi:hypothetical protein
MSCKQAYFNGWGSCAALMDKMNGAALQTKGNTWTDASALVSATWQTAIADDDSAIRDTLMLPIQSFENTTDDLEITTSQLGKKLASGKPIPSGMIALDASLCDYKQLHVLEDTLYEFIPFFQDGTFWLSRKTDGTLKGFRVKIATKAGLPPEDKSLSYPVYLFFDNYNEFEDVVVVSPDFEFTDLLDYSPAGLDVRVTTDYTGGDVIILITSRGTGLGKTGLSVAGDHEIMDTNATPTVVVTVVSDDGLGYYTLTIKKDNAGTPTNLAATDYIDMQCHDVSGSNLTYLSHAFRFWGGA